MYHGTENWKQTAQRPRLSRSSQSQRAHTHQHLPPDQSKINKEKEKKTKPIHLSRLVTLTGLYIWTFLAQMRSDIKVSASYLWAAFAIFCAIAKKTLHGWQSRKNKSYATHQQLQNVLQQLCTVFQAKNPSGAAQLSCEFLIINNPERCFAAVGLWHLQLAPSFHSTAACLANKRSSAIRRRKGNILPIIILQTRRWRVAWNDGR